MTRDDLDQALDAMNQAAMAAGAANLGPGLITVDSDHWCASLSDALRATCRALQDGLRYRDIQIHVGAAQTPAVLSREQAEGRGEPYRDLAATHG